MQQVDEIPIFRSFRFKLILFFVLLITGLQVTTFVAVYQATLINVLVQIENQLLNTSHTFRRQLESRAGNLAREAGILATDYGFRTAVATSDRPTILSALKSLNKRISGDRAMVISLENEIIADSFDEDDHGGIFPFSELIEIADVEDKAASIVVLNNIIYEFTVVPVLAPIPIAWIAIGQAVDDVLAEGLKEQSPFDLDISFGLLSDANSLKLKGSTFNPRLKEELQEINFNDISMGAPVKIKTQNDTYVSLIKQLNTIDADTKTVVLLQYSLDLAMKPYRTLMLWFLGISLASLLVALIVGILIARGVTRPVKQLSLAVRRIRTGDYDSPVPVARMDELGRLAEGFNYMMEGIKSREEKIFFQARHDALTGLPNRLNFELQLDKILEKNKDNKNQFCVVFIGVGRLTEIKNTLGYQVGDMAIKLISKRLVSAVGESDILARLGNDEFILLLPSMKLDQLNSILGKLQDCFNEPITVEEVNMDVSAHLGVACYPVHGESGKLLMQRADAAMFVARKSAVTTTSYTIYDEATDPHTLNRLSLMGELRAGIKQNEFELYYQPKISLKTRKVTHVETLIRWMHPTKGFMTPDDFIPLAEQTGNIHLITDFSLRAAMKQCAKWRKNGYAIKAAVNISAKDLLSPIFLEKIELMLKEFEIDPDWIILEITESAIMQDPEKALEMLKRLDRAGIKLSIDDFGTGYSSMSYIKKLPIKEIKIDKSFVQELSINHEDAVIVKSTIEMSHNLGLTVIAEGVEDEKALNMLMDFGCDLGQGYYFSKPLPLSEMDKWLLTSEWRTNKSMNQDNEHN